MKSIPGHEVCDRLKEIRKLIAKRLGVNLNIPKCGYDGPCPGTCPQCESEAALLDEALQRSPHIDISGVGASVCNGFDPTGLPTISPDYLTEYLNQSENQTIKKLKRTVMQLQVELDQHQQLPKDQQDKEYICNHIDGIRNLKRLIKQISNK